MSLIDNKKQSNVTLFLSDELSNELNLDKEWTKNDYDDDIDWGDKPSESSYDKPSESSYDKIINDLNEKLRKERISSFQKDLFIEIERIKNIKLNKDLFLKFAQYRKKSKKREKKLKDKNYQLQVNYVQLQANYYQLQSNCDQMQANYSQLQANYAPIQANNAILQDNNYIYRKSLKRSVETLSIGKECSVCFETLDNEQKPIITCKEGHYCCNECFSKLDRCHICRQNLF